MKIFIRFSVIIVMFFSLATLEAKSSVLEIQEKIQKLNQEIQTKMKNYELSRKKGLSQLEEKSSLKDSFETKENLLLPLNLSIEKANLRFSEQLNELKKIKRNSLAIHQSRLKNNLKELDLKQKESLLNSEAQLKKNLQDSSQIFLKNSQKERLKLFRFRSEVIGEKKKLSSLEDHFKNLKLEFTSMIRFIQGSLFELRNSGLRKTFLKKDYRLTSYSFIVSILKIFAYVLFLIFLIRNKVTILSHCTNTCSKTLAFFSTKKKRPLVQNSFKVAYIIAIYYVVFLVFNHITTELGWNALQTLNKALLVSFILLAFNGLFESIKEKGSFSLWSAEKPKALISSYLKFISALVFIPKIIQFICEIFVKNSYSENMLCNFSIIMVVLIFLKTIKKNISDWNYCLEKAFKTQSSSQMNLVTLLKSFFLGLPAAILLSKNGLKEQLSELKVAKSFQASLSRFVLERKKLKRRQKVTEKNFPENYVQHFSHNENFSSDYYSQREEEEKQFEESYVKWKETQRGGFILILGDRGVGKSSFLQNIKFKKKEDHFIFAQLKSGNTVFEDCLKSISQELFNKEVFQKELFKDELQQLQSSVIVLENLENSILRSVGGYDTLEEIIDLILSSAEKHLWVVSFNPYSWSIANRAIKQLNCFSQKILINNFKECEIKELILKRNELAGNHSLDFSTFQLKNNTENTHSQNQDLYFRLLWDYTRGNPRRAIYFWLNSLQWNQKKLKVDLFDIPEQDTLEELSDRTLMFLACIIEHNGLTLKEATRVLEEDQTTLKRRIEEMKGYGILNSLSNRFHGEESETFHIDSFWIKAVENYLEKRHMLFKGDSE